MSKDSWQDLEDKLRDLAGKLELAYHAISQFQWKEVDKSVFDEGQKVLAVCISEPGVIYTCMARGWFMDVVYTCWFEKGEFIIEPHGPRLPATYWMPIPEPPK